MIQLMMEWTRWIEAELYLCKADPAAIEICQELRHGIMELAATRPGLHVADSSDSRHVQ